MKKAQKLPPPEERAADMRHTLILAIIDKCERMEMSDLQEIYRASLKAVERLQKGKEIFFEG